MDKSSPKKKGSFSASEVGVLIEDFQSRLNIVAEGQGLLNEKSDKLSAKTDLIYEELGRQRIDVRIIKKDIADIKTTLGVHDGRLSRLEEAVLK